ncbi:MAG: hypothetical protein A3I43_03490 [Omnitrophica WOR_2 bacterium RIFCSPLOWO2_02_FULL_50_19]|nr:MAG: hypothetical protein A3I43_03490 [Omnitrophica WOR_2 bacterium RIFCSPLOWO2_02_FULL_50_19]
MSRFVQLSYRIDERSPLYPGTPALEIRNVKEIDKGDSCNTFSMTLSNHSGTHIDAPRHFLNSGKPISEYLPDELIYNRPCLIDCPKGKDELIGVKDLQSLSGKDDFDALLIRTGFCKYRNSNAEIYGYHNPCLTPEAAKWIRENYPKIRLIGIDTISISSYAHKGLGPLTHKILLGQEGFDGPPILILEDMNLPDSIKKVDELIIVPVFSGRIDSSPCTALGVIHD